VEPDKRHLVVSGLLSVFKKIWPEFWGPRMEHILRNAIFTLLEQPGSTLLDIPPILTDKIFRERAIAKVSNRIVRNFWFQEFDKYSVWLRSEATAPILNKVGQFLATPLIRNIVGQPKSAFNLRQVMDEGKILVVDLAKGRIGDDNCSLLGSLLVTKLQLAALSRADTPDEKRKPFHLYIDEIHSFLTLSFTDILSEARKYKLYLVMSHQYLDQLDERMRAAVFGNVGTLISFRVGAIDAKYLATEFYPTFDETDLVNIPNHHIYLKMMIDGHTSRAFSAVTMPPRKSDFSYRKTIIASSREKYGTRRGEVEKKMTIDAANKELPAAKQSSLF
jgi:Type IV secretion-system coupling protein DNA-binding domain.